MKQRITKKSIADWIEVVILLLVFLVYLFFRVTLVKGASMEPTLHDGELHLISRWTQPAVGDIVVLEDPDADKLLIKRITAGEGDFVSYYQGERVLGPEEYFVEGDNRDCSVDSRYFGPITRDAIVGVLVF